jgi:2-phosphosulfolactate phosphatase
MQEKSGLDVCLSPLLVKNYNLTNTIVVIIDIVRATSVISTALSYGIEHIVALDSIEETKSLKNQGYLIAGERNGDKLEGFDFGNSPLSFMDRNLEGKKLAMTTTNGTFTIKTVEKAAENFEGVEILLGGFVNYTVLRNYLFESKKHVLLVCSGWKCNFSIEDTIFAGKLAEDINRYSRFRFLSDSANHAILIYEQAKENIFNFVLDHSTRFKDKIGLLGQDIRYCLKQDVVHSLPFLVDGRILNKIF